MRLVVSHFFNESYLMPWWLKHHRETFDHGVIQRGLDLWVTLLVIVTLIAAWMALALWR
jgi:hypothetical protein